MINIPLMLVPWAIYNVLIVGTALSPWEAVAFRLDLPSGAELTMTSGDILVLVGLLALLLDVLKAARSDASARMELALSGAMVVAFALELMILEGAGSATFLVLGAMAVVDCLAATYVARRHGAGGRLTLDHTAEPLHGEQASAEQAPLHS